MSDTLLRWAELVAVANGRTCVGMEGVRDPEHPCEAFRPGTPAGDCQSDGHYLCGECSRRLAGCLVCGETPDRCDCPACDLRACYEAEAFVELNASGGIGRSLCIDHAKMLASGSIAPLGDDPNPASLL